MMSSVWSKELFSEFQWLHWINTLARTMRYDVVLFSCSYKLRTRPSSWQQIMWTSSMDCTLTIVFSACTGRIF
jgi:hypothetical protein